MTRIAAIIPAFNEEHSIESVILEIRLLAKTRNLNLDVVVINDCSSDETSQKASRLDCIVIDLPINLGIGGAVQTGIRYACENGYDFSVQIDGDGQHPPEELILLLEAQHKNDWNLVIGSRFIEKQGFQSSQVRRVGIRFFRFLNKMLTGLDITDCTSGFRLLDRKAMELAQSYYPDEYPEPESIVYFARHRLRIGETAISMKERQSGVSSIRYLDSLYYMSKVSLAILFTFIRTKKH
jgi:glycosyltransferase involved in cell wall biosynthesis